METTTTEVLKGVSQDPVIQFGTNQVLKEEKNNRIVYYLPCYVRFKVKEITELDIEGLKATLAGTLLFSLYYGDLDKQILKQFTGKGTKYILLQFGRQASIQLKQEDKGVTFKTQQKNRIVNYVVRDQFTCRLEGDVFYTPFELINLYLNITIQSLPLDPDENNDKRIDIKFNCMRSDEVIMLQHSENKTFGNYHIANYFFDCKYKNSQKNPFKPISVLRTEQQDNVPIKRRKHKKSVQQQNTRQIFPLKKEKHEEVLQMNTPEPKKVNKKEEGDSDAKIKNFQYAHFRIPMYKYPGVNLISIFVPLWILGFINLFIFFQDTVLANRIAGIATLTLAFIAFIPTINDKIPQTPNIKLVEILVYMQAAASILCLIQSYKVSGITDPYDWTTDGFFISALILNLLTVFIVLLLFIVHKCWWQKVYTRPKNESKKESVLLKSHWNNLQCDAVFQDHIRHNRITII